MINWSGRAEQVWQKFPERRQTAARLLQIAAAQVPHAIGSDERARDKLSGKRRASDAFAHALFLASGFEALGFTIDDWVGDVPSWERALFNIPSLDARVVLDELSAAGGLAVAIRSIPDRQILRLRRAGSGDPPDAVVSLNEYFVLKLTYTGAEALAPAHLLLAEWSGASNDWQIVNALSDCSIDARRPVDLKPANNGASVEIALGVRVAPPRGEFDLYVLAQRKPFDARAFTMLSALGADGIMAPRQMAKLIDLIRQSRSGVVVGKIRYAVQ